MTNEEIKSLYLAAEKALATLNSPYGEAIRTKNPKLYETASRIADEYRNKYYEVLLNEKQGAKALVAETQEAVDVLGIVPQTDYLAIQELNTLITTNSEKLQNELLFDASLFYDKYFLGLPSKIIEAVNEDVSENVRFREWFGNSKVVDANGKPLIVFHGSGGRTTEFSNFKFTPFPGNYFAENKSYADWFATYRGGNKYLFKCYLRVQNPIDLTPFKLDKVKYEDFVSYVRYEYGYELPENKMLRAMSEKMDGMWAWRYLRGGVDWLKFIATRNEFDGFNYYENNPDDMVKGKENSTKAWMVLHPNQIKSADLRNSTYSLMSKDIRMKQGGSI